MFFYFNMKIVLVVFVNIVFAVFICADAFPQHQEVQEINDNIQNSNHTKQTDEKKPEAIHSEVANTVNLPITNPINNTKDKDIRRDLFETNTIQAVLVKERPQEGILSKLYRIISVPITRFAKAPKVITVMSNIGTCIVNGAMEIISFYFPAPLIPLIASAAGLVIPFEPVVLLKERMPVTSYRRAFQKAVHGFLGTFDKFKYDEDDPYMTRRFNRPNKNEFEVDD